MRTGVNRIGDDLIIIKPYFIHEFGDRFHHMSMIRTCEIDECGELVRGTGPSNGQVEVHEFLDYYFFYPIREGLRRTF